MKGPVPSAQWPHTDPGSSACVETEPGDRGGQQCARILDCSVLVAGLIYGSDIIRTDGETILCATLDEMDNDRRVHKVVTRL